MSLSAALDTAIRGREVPAALLEAAFEEIIAGSAPPAQVAGLLVALRSKGETVDEIAAVARVLRARATPAPACDPRAVDTCGTGGDGGGTFNISTTATFVVAGAGIPVAKHGNRAISSRTGSMDVLEALGVRIDLPVERSAALLEEVGVAPFFAQVAHPAMKAVGPVRRELGVRTLMNGLGPLLNPVGVRRQVVGVYAREMVEPLAEALVRLGSERALTVHGSDGLDEITTTGPTHAALGADGKVEALQIDPEALGLPLASAADLAGGDVEENVALLRAVLAGEPGPRRDIVVLNAAAAIWVGGVAESLEEGLRFAAQSIDGGAASARLAALIAASNRDPA